MPKQNVWRQNSSCPTKLCVGQVKLIGSDQTNLVVVCILFGTDISDKN